MVQGREQGLAELRATDNQRRGDGHQELCAQLPRRPRARLGADWTPPLPRPCSPLPRSAPPMHGWCQLLVLCQSPVTSYLVPLTLFTC